MPHQIQNIGDYHAGDALLITVDVEDDNGNAVDISNANSIEWYLKNDETDADGEAVLSKTLAGGGISITDGAGGQFEIKIDTGETDGEAGTYHHRSRLEDSNGDRSTLFHGDFTISV